MMKKTWDIVSTVVVALVLVLAILLAGVRIIGYTPFAVLSPSMTPLYQPGDLVYARAQEPETIEQGTVITFLIGDDTTVTHRVDEVDRENRCFYTKGDANDTRDTAPVLYENVVGVVKFSIPKLGYVSNFLNTRKGKYIAFMAFCGWLLLMILPGLFSGKKEKTAKEP